MNMESFERGGVLNPRGTSARSFRQRAGLDAHRRSCERADGGRRRGALSRLRSVEDRRRWTVRALAGPAAGHGGHFLEASKRGGIVSRAASSIRPSSIGSVGGRTDAALLAHRANAEEAVGGAGAVGTGKGGVPRYQVRAAFKQNLHGAAGVGGYHDGVAWDVDDWNGAGR